jgi:hypothetical protein
MAVTREAMQQQHSIGPLGIEFAPGFVGDLDVMQHLATF